MVRGSKAQQRSKAVFFAALETSIRIYGPAREMCKYDFESFGETTYQPTVAAKVVGLAFLGVTCPRF